MLILTFFNYLHIVGILSLIVNISMTPGLRPMMLHGLCHDAQPQSQSNVRLSESNWLSKDNQH